jgi:hypothetical protein
MAASSSVLEPVIVGKISKTYGGRKLMLPDNMAALMAGCLATSRVLAERSSPRPFIPSHGDDL